MSKRNSLERIDLQALGHDRFVDLVAALVYPLATWREVRRLPGVPGSLVDLVGRESLEEGAYRDWWVKVIPAHGFIEAASQLCKDIAAGGRSPDVLLLVTSAELSSRQSEGLLAEAVAAGVGHPLIWAESAVNRMLRTERPDLLFSFLGVDSSRRVRIRARSARRRLTIKRRLLKLLLVPPEERRKSISQPFEKMRYAKLVIRSVDDESYPSVSHSIGTTPGWLLVGTYDFYHNGLEVIIGTVDVIVNEARQWRPVAARERFDRTRFQRLRAYEVGRIPFANVVACDTMGDEYHREPHLLCTFSSGGHPFEDYRYYSVAEPFRVVLDPDLMLDESGANSQENDRGVKRA